MASQRSSSTRCHYCGNNPISHTSSWISSTFTFVLDPFFRKILRVPGGTSLLEFSSYLIDRLEDALIYTRIVRFTPDSTKIVSDRGMVMHEEAIARGWNMEIGTIFGRGIDMYRLTLPRGKTLTFKGLPKFKSTDVHENDWIDDKALLKERLNAEGIPVSRGSSFTTLNEAEEFMKSLKRPVIVKPRLGSRGRHTITFLTESNDFRKAFDIVQQLGPHVIVEEHLVGSVYRGTMIDGILSGVLAGDPPRVTGDGISTILKLIEKKNESRHERVGAFQTTPLTEIFLNRRGYTLPSIVPSGVTIDLSEKIGLSYGGNAREVTPLTHPKLREELERAARIVGDPIIGFDFISTDISLDPDTVRWGIIECNAIPFINLHHDPLEGEPVNAAGILLDYVERTLKTSP